MDEVVRQGRSSMTRFEGHALFSCAVELYTALASDVTRGAVEEGCTALQLTRETREYWL